MPQAMTQAHWIAAAIGTAAGVLVVYLLIRLNRRDVPPIGRLIETNGEADLETHLRRAGYQVTKLQSADSLSDQIREVAKGPRKDGVITDVKDTF